MTPPTGKDLWADALVAHVTKQERTWRKLDVQRFERNLLGERQYCTCSDVDPKVCTHCWQAIQGQK